MLARLIEERRVSTFGELARALGMQKSNITRYIKELEQYRLVSVSKKGRVKEVFAQYGHFTEFVQARENLPHIRLEDVLAGKMLFLLAHLQYMKYWRASWRKKQTFRVRDITLSPVTTKRLLVKLRQLGVVHMVSRGNYVVRAEANSLLWFCGNFLTELCAAKAETELKGLEKIYVSFANANEPEVICVTNVPSAPKNYWPTAYSVLHDYGISIISAGKYYYSNHIPAIVDVIIHILALGKDARSVMYGAALMVKNPFDYNVLRNKVKKEYCFNISEKFMENLLAFVESRGRLRAKGFPEWGEVLEVCA